jgi:hypothetical protein
LLGPAGRRRAREPIIQRNDPVERVLSEPAWADRLTDADRRALTPLFWTHVNPYGKFTLDMDSQLNLDPPAAAAAAATPA